MSAGHPDYDRSIPIEPLGTRLAALRKVKGIELGRAAYETKIRATTLREIEADNFSCLPPAYIRMVLRNYARYLGMPAGEIEASLPESAGFGVEGFAYIRNAPANEKFFSRGKLFKDLHQHGVRTLVVPILLACLFFAGFQIFLTARKLERIQRVTSLASQNQLKYFLTPEQEVRIFRAVGENDSDWLLDLESVMVRESPKSEVLVGNSLDSL